MLASMWETWIFKNGTQSIKWDIETTSKAPLQVCHDGPAGKQNDV